MLWKQGIQTPPRGADPKCALSSVVLRPLPELQIPFFRTMDDGRRTTDERRDIYILFCKNEYESQVKWNNMSPVDQITNKSIHPSCVVRRSSFIVCHP